MSKEPKQEYKDLEINEEFKGEPLTIDIVRMLEIKPPAQNSFMIENFCKKGGHFLSTSNKCDYCGQGFVTLPNDEYLGNHEYPELKNE